MLGSWSNPGGISLIEAPALTPPGEMISIIKKKHTFYPVSAPGLLPENPAKEPLSGKSPFFWGAKARLLPDPENNSAKIYLSNSLRGSYRVFR